MKREESLADEIHMFELELKWKPKGEFYQIVKMILLICNLN